VTNAIKSALSKASTQAILAAVVISTGCALAWRGDIDGPTFVGIMLAVIAWLYPRSREASS
jgi:hypothetical protein